MSVGRGWRWDGEERGSDNVRGEIVMEVLDEKRMRWERGERGGGSGGGGGVDKGWGCSNRNKGW